MGTLIFWSAVLIPASSAVTAAGVWLFIKRRDELGRVAGGLLTVAGLILWIMTGAVLYGVAV